MRVFYDEPAAVAAWEACRQNADAGFWIVTPAGRFGTRDPETQTRTDQGDLVLQTCLECHKDFYAQARWLVPLCQGCAMCIRPAETISAPEELEDLRHRRSRRWHVKHGGERPPQEPEE